MKGRRKAEVTEILLYLLLLVLNIPGFAQSGVENNSWGAHVNIPLVYKSTLGQQEYVLLHYWDKISAKELTSSPDLHEKLLVDYINLYKGMSNNTIEASLRKMTSVYLNDSLMMKQILQLSEKYFYNPNSPVRNEDWYTPVIEVALTSSYISPTQKIKLNYVRTLMSKNKVNTLATNFKMTLANRSELELYSVESEYIVLYFSNPDCLACIETTNELAQDRKSTRLNSSHRT